MEHPPRRLFHVSEFSSSKYGCQPTSLLVERFISSVWCIAANHLLVLANSDALSLDDLHILKTRQDLVLDLELGNHGELGSLLDLEWFILESGLGAWGGEVNSHWWTAGGVHGQGENDALALIVWIGQRWASAEAERGLVTLKRLILGIYLVLD